LLYFLHMEKELHPELVNEAEQAPVLAPDRYNEMYNEAREGFYEEKEKTESEKIEDVKSSILETTKNRTLEAVVPDKNETVFTLPNKESSSTPWLKKAATVAGITLMSLLPWKEAKSQNKVDSDKKNNTTKISSANESHELNDQNKYDWNEYIDWLEVRGLKASPKLNSVSFAVETMNKFIKEHPGTTVSPQIVKDVQFTLKEYKSKLDLAEKKEEQKGRTIASYAKNGDKGITFMNGLDETKLDGIAGQYTTSYKFPSYTLNTTKIQRVNLPNGSSMESYTTNVENKGLVKNQDILNK
jgi:hypothetical protein